MSTTKPAELLIDLLPEIGLDGFIVPMADQHQGEYVTENNMRLRWLTGFTGSAGTAVVYRRRVHLFVDGRYTVQAGRQTNPAFVDIHGHREPSPVEWLAACVGEGERIGYDPGLHCMAEAAALKTAMKKKNCRAVGVERNPIDGLWPDRPPPPVAPVHHHDIAYSGRGSDDKIRAVAGILVESAIDAVVLNRLESIAWIFNIRGGDTPFAPLVQGYAIVRADGRADLFGDPNKYSERTLAMLGEKTGFNHMDEFPAQLDRAGGDVLNVGLDRKSMTEWVRRRLKNAGAKITHLADPTELPRACKNDTEIDGARLAHRRDAVAVIGFLKWFDETVTGEPLTELDMAAKIHEFRARSELFRGPSFATIAGSGPNAAVVHYIATAQTNRRLEQGSLLLLDSGGQYPDGTTDITRTLPVGEPDPEMRRHFTLVLKGHMAIASARFPAGTSGGQLDALARQHLWRAGLDYRHGTGHGVGSYLGVHEGPQRIAAGSTVPLEAGMIVSNEPGLYLDGRYGIRIENLLVVRESDVEDFLEFEPLTLVPMDRRLIDDQLLDNRERRWLDDYHQLIHDQLAEHLNDGEKAWLLEKL